MQWKASPSRRRSSTRLPATAPELAATSTTRKAATIMTMPSVLEISRQATLKPVTEIAADAGLPPWLIEPYGEHVAKIDLAATHPAAEHMDLDADGRIAGLS